MRSAFNSKEMIEKYDNKTESVKIRKNDVRKLNDDELEQVSGGMKCKEIPDRVGV
ncbi:MAG: bacteriocin [Lachnospiraceae bacterium]|nr:bacteriocin [Lachnospiraceae bacterium]